MHLGRGRLAQGSQCDRGEQPTDGNIEPWWTPSVHCNTSNISRQTSTAAKVAGESVLGSRSARSSTEGCQDSLVRGARGAPTIGQRVRRPPRGHRKDRGMCIANITVEACGPPDPTGGWAPAHDTHHGSPLCGQCRTLHIDSGYDDSNADLVPDNSGSCCVRLTGQCEAMPSWCPCGSDTDADTR